MGNRNTQKVRRRRNKRNLELGMKEVESFISNCKKVVITTYRKVNWQVIDLGLPYEIDILPSRVKEAIRLYSDCEFDDDFQASWSKYRLKHYSIGTGTKVRVAFPYGQHEHKGPFNHAMTVWLYSQLTTVAKVAGDFSVEEISDSVVIIFQKGDIKSWNDKKKNILPSNDYY